MDALLTPHGVLALLTLTFLKIVLGVDNVIFPSILSGKLPVAQHPRARRTGLLASKVVRIGLLLSITWIIPRRCSPSSDGRFQDATSS